MLVLKFCTVGGGGAGVGVVELLHAVTSASAVKPAVALRNEFGMNTSLKVAVDTFATLQGSHLCGFQSVPQMGENAPKALYKRVGNS